jgi:hypothetical protein
LISRTLTPHASQSATQNRTAPSAEALRWFARFCVERRDATLGDLTAAALVAPPSGEPLSPDGEQIVAGRHPSPGG